MTLTAVLIAGGESRRMGRDKATLMIEGKPLWSRQLDTLRGLQPDQILVSSRSRPIWSPAEIGVVLDEPPSRGPLSGISAALKNIQSTHLLALAIDLPEMTTEHLLQLWWLAKPGIGVIPRWCDSYEPMAAIYPAEAAFVAQDALEAGRLSLQSLVERLLERNLVWIHPIDDDDRHLYHNVNSPADLTWGN
jgi:molybdopterin-guanine dinucleotide biosynthesis protein A